MQLGGLPRMWQKVLVLQPPDQDGTHIFSRPTPQSGLNHTADFSTSIITRTDSCNKPLSTHLYKYRLLALLRRTAPSFLVACHLLLLNKI